MHVLNAMCLDDRACGGAGWYSYGAVGYASLAGSCGKLALIDDDWCADHDPDDGKEKLSRVESSESIGGEPSAAGGEGGEQ